MEAQAAHEIDACAHPGRVFGVKTPLFFSLQDL
jgi:hypothetical protein